jgi:iron complex transport system substrate-binding protein
MIKSLFLLFFAFLFFSCENAAGKVKTVEGTSIKYAKHFDLEEKKGFTLLTINNPETNEPEQEFVLVKRGTVVNLEPGQLKIEVPVQGMGALATGFIGMISELDEVNSIKLSTDSKYIYNAALRKNIAANKVLTTDYEGAASPAEMLSRKVELILFSGFGSPYPNQDKLQQLGINCMAIYDWKELDPLAKAEWIKLFGALYDKKEEANVYFAQVETNYKELKSKISKSKHKEIVITGGMFGDIWNATAGESFLAGIMKDAGMDYLYKNTKGTGSNQYSLAKIITDEEKCTRWLNAEAKSMDELLRLNPKFAALHTVKIKQVYSYLNKTNYFWEYNSMRPDWLLEDFAMIGGTLPMKKMHFYQKLK